MAIPAPIYKRISAPNILPPFFSRYIYIITIQKDIKKCKKPKNLVFRWLYKHQKVFQFFIEVKKTK